MGFWSYLVRFILRNRLVNIIIIFLITVFMAYKGSHVEMSYEFAQMLPKSDSTFIKYDKFTNTFGQDGSVLFVGIKDDKLFNLEVFNDWYDLTYKIKEIEGVQETVSLAKMYQLVKNDSLKKFDFKLVAQNKPKTQKELDSLINIMFSLPFYDGILFNKVTNSTILGVTIHKDAINSKGRYKLISQLKSLVDDFGSKHNIEVHYSGMPYIRTITSKKIQDELLFFVFLSLIIASIALLIFFRSFKAVIFPLIIVIISVIWLMGILVLLNYKITVLTGILPPLIIIIGIENCIFLLNKYHHEFKFHGNKVKALARVVQRVGNATFLTNLTTATGFAAFIVTGNRMLVEFGTVAAINIMIVFLLSLFLIPIFYSYIKPPKPRHLKHLDNKFTIKILDKIVFLVLNRRTVIYIVSIVFLGLGIFGMTKLKTSGRVVDDMPKKEKMYQDILYFEKELKGILPFEISIDTKKKKGVMSLATIKRIDRLQDTLATYPEFSKPVSIAEVVKFSKQAFFNGKEEYYSLPNSREKAFILSYVPDMKSDKKTILNSFVDTNLQVTRISVHMANIGTKDIQRIKDDIRPKIDSIFNPEKYDVDLTGTSVVFLKGSDYLVGNLLTSLLLAICAITLLMALLFTSFKMVGISLIPNILPQIMTAALMGFFAISIKPSTLLIFSVALGISVDNAIHFLSRYRIMLKLTDWNIKESVIEALKETGYSMIYSSIVLFFGFAIFTQSTFGGTEAMGYLISFTLLVAVLSNLLLLPSLLLTLDKRITTKRFKEPMLEIFDEEEDIELDDLEIE
ncbi:MAG: MMPL family transporter [Saprospiraceae bacterium]|nr:MMPL family transporter [Saprospiraceae bacterium]